MKSDIPILIVVHVIHYRKHNLRVREHNILGPYVDDLSTLAVSSFEVKQLADLNKNHSCLSSQQYLI